MNKAIRISTIAVVAVIILRGISVVVIEKGSAVFVAETATLFYTEYAKPGVGLQRDETSSDHTTNKQVSFYEYGFQSTPAIGALIDLEDLMKDSLEKCPDAQVRVRNIRCSGLFSMPLFKEGECKYSLEVQGVGSSGRAYSGTMAGRIDISITGLTSSAKAKDLIAEETAKLLFSDISKELK